MLPCDGTQKREISSTKLPNLFFIKKDLVPQEIVHTQDNSKAAREFGGSLTLSDT